MITNDDIKSSPFARFGGLFYTSTGSINDCDANCFGEVRQLASAGTNPNWRREVLEQIEFVRSDSEWQAYLHDLYDAHNKVCQLQFDKADELKRSGNMRNLGPQEIAIAEKYDTKMGAAQENLSGAVARQPALQERFVDKPYASSFARMQGMRMQTGFCAQMAGDLSAGTIIPQHRVYLLSSASLPIVVFGSSLRAEPFGRSNQSESFERSMKISEFVVPMPSCSASATTR